MAATTTVKYGIVGVGMMGREHLINLHHLRNEGVSVVCIADPHVPSQKLAIDVACSFDWSPHVCLFLLFYYLCIQTTRASSNTLS